MRTYKINDSGQEFSVPALKIKNEIWFHWKGQNHCITIARKSRSRQEAIGSLNIAAPMPGKIIQVSCAEGDPVSAGSVLVIMEAMKMEYRMEASQNCLVKKCLCKEGQQVQLGEVLIELAAVDSTDSNSAGTTTAAHDSKTTLDQNNIED